MSDTKKCTKCGVVKSAAFFYRAKSRPLGLSCWCKQCNFEYYKKNKEKIAKYKKDYEIKNKDKIQKRREEYERKNKSEIRKRNKVSVEKYRLKNRDKVRERDFAYRAKNKGRLKEYAAKRAGDLKYTYVARLIIGKGSELGVDSIPNVLVEAKRMQILINRTLKEMKNAKHE